MMTTLALLAQTGDEVQVSRLTANLKEALFLIGALSGVLLVAAVYIYVRWKRRRHAHRHHRASTSADGAQPGAEDGRERGRRKWRKRRRYEEEYSRRNPTLAETGGLPPKREGSPVAPAQAPAPPPQV